MAYPRSFAVQGALPPVGDSAPCDKHLPELQCFRGIRLLPKEPFALKVRSWSTSFGRAVAKVITSNTGQREVRKQGLSSSGFSNPSLLLRYAEFFP